MRKKSLLSIFYLCLLLAGTLYIPLNLTAQTTPGTPQRPPIEIDVLGTCIPASSGGSGGGGGGGTPSATKFFVRYTQQPDSVYWLFERDPLSGDSLFSRQLQPIHTFSDAGTKNVILHAVYGEDTVVYDPYSLNIKQSEAQLQIKEEGKEQPVQEVVLCGEPKTLIATVGDGSSGGGGGGGGAGGGIGGGTGGGGGGGTPVTWYKPQSADESPVTADRIVVDPNNVDDNGKVKDVGTYYVTYEDPQTGCLIYQTFRVVVYNEEDQNGSIWYFGEGAGIDFRGGATPIQSSALVGGNSAPEGNAIIGDPNADILFQTNGESLWYGNDEHPGGNGTNLGGSRNVTQNSLFVDFPADPTLFYLFTINENRQLSFSTLDLKAYNPPPYPGVALSESPENLGFPLKNIPLHQPVAEKLTSTSRKDGGYWVLVHELNSNAFLSYPVSGEGIGAPVRSEVGSFVGNTADEAVGYMRFSEGGSILASTINNPTAIELFRFNGETGTVSDPIQLPIDERGTLYGLSFVGNRLYATVNNPNGPSYLYQYTVDTTFDLPTILKSKVTLTVQNEELGAIQQGPNGTLYIARNGKGELFQIQSPNDSLTSSFRLIDNTFDLEGGTSTLGLPNFGENAGSSVPEASISATSVCVGDSVYVSATQRYSNDITLKIELLDESQQTVLRTYTTAATGQGGEITIPAEDYNNKPGTYFVRLSITNECSPPPTFDYPGPGDEPVIAQFTVSAKPTAELVTEQTLELCDDQSVTFIGRALVNGQQVDPSTVNFVWFDAISNAVVGTGPEFTADEPGAWRFFVANGTGCTSDTLNVEAIDLRPKVSIGNDFSVCVGAPLPQQELTATVAPPDNANDFNFQWRMSDNDGESWSDVGTAGQSLSLANFNTSLPGTYQYVLEASYKDPNLPCFKADTLTITVAPTPQVRIVASNNNCNGQATLTAEVEGAIGEVTYNWEGPAGSFTSTSPQVSITESGTYSVSILDGNSGCTVPSNELNIDLQDPLGDVELEVVAGCAAEGMVVTSQIRLITSYSRLQDLSIRWYNLDVSETEEVQEFHNETEIFVEDGTYRVVVEINDPNSQCTNTSGIDEVTVTQTELPQRQLRPVYVICPSIEEMSSDTLTVTGFTEYEWKNVATGQVLDRDSVFIVNREGEYELRVNGCSDPVRFRVRFDCTPTLWVPNVIRPDSNDPLNSTFRILNDNPYVKDFQILILNRWGEVIWQSNDPAFEWRGTDRRGNSVMVNTYVYVITYRNQFGEDQEIKKQRGGITVLK